MFRIRTNQEAKLQMEVTTEICSTAEMGFFFFVLFVFKIVYLTFAVTG